MTFHYNISLYFCRSRGSSTRDPWRELLRSGFEVLSVSRSGFEVLDASAIRVRGFGRFSDQGSRFWACRYKGRRVMRGTPHTCISFEIFGVPWLGFEVLHAFAIRVRGFGCFSDQGSRFWACRDQGSKFWTLLQLGFEVLDAFAIRVRGFGWAAIRVRSFGREI